MKIMHIDQAGLVRRTTLKTVLTGVFILAPFTTLISSAATATTIENMPKNQRHLIHALTSIGKPVCNDAAGMLATSSGTSEAFELHLRGANLNITDARVLAEAMQRSAAGNGFYLTSFSASFNPELGDTGVAALIAAFPDTLTELGLVGCSIGDAGGLAILQWARHAPALRMLCVEDNRFSADMRLQLQNLARQERKILVVV